MRPNTPRELLLQNLLAVSSVLLYRSTKLLSAGTTSERENLTIEIEEWFDNSRTRIAEMVRQDCLDIEVKPSPMVSIVQTPWVPPLPNVPPLDEEALQIISQLNYFLR